MNTMNRMGRNPGTVLDRIFDVAYGTDAEIEHMSAAQVSAELRDSGFNTDKSWGELQRMLRVSEGKIRMAEAKVKRQQRSAAESVVAAAAETKEALIAQIIGFINLSGSAGVYARKWEDSSVEDLKSLRDALARTAARAGAKKKEGQ